MATTISGKQRVVTQLLGALGKRVKSEQAEERPVLEQFIYAICREGATASAAEEAFQCLRSQFFDWNEIRVSSAREIADALEPHLSEAEMRAQRIIDLLQEVFETTFSFDLDPLVKKGVKQAAKQLIRYKAANEYAVAWVVQKSLGGHALPLDAASFRVLGRLGLIEDGQADSEELRSSLENQIPKTKGQIFVDLVSVLAEDHCWESDPNCPRCPLLSSCPVGQEMKPAMLSGTSKKPR